MQWRKKVQECAQSLYFTLPCLCSFSAGLLLKSGLGLVAGKIITPLTPQSHVDSMACGLRKCKKSVFSVLVGNSIMVNTFIYIT